jgi:hypothetical protein
MRPNSCGWSSNEKWPDQVMTSIAAFGKNSAYCRLADSGWMLFPLWMTSAQHAHLLERFFEFTSKPKPRQPRRPEDGSNPDLNPFAHRNTSYLLFADQIRV